MKNVSFDFFYREFVRPHVVFDQQRSPMNSFETNSTDIDVSKCEIVHIEDSEMLPNILPLNEYLFDEPRTGNIMLEQPKDFEHGK